MPISQQGYGEKMYLSTLIIVIIVTVKIFCSELYAGDSDLSLQLSLLENPQQQISPDAGLKKDCNNNLNTEGDIEGNLAEESVPINVFRKDSNLHFGIRLKNDIFASPVNLFRYGSLIVFDQGETHGTEVDIGVKLEDGRNIQYLFESNLYTQRSPYPFLAETSGFFQDYTTEQIHQLSINNLETNDLFTYDVTFGALGYVRDDDEDVTLASTQQKLLHNKYDIYYLGTDYYEVENHHKPQNEYGMLFRANVGLSATSVNKDNFFGQVGRIYVAPELSNLRDRNNLELGLSYDAYISAKNKERDLPFGVTLPKDAFRAHIGIDLPVSIHQVHEETASKWSTNLSPELKLGLSIGDLEIGYSTDMVFGTLPNYIPENRNNTILYNGEAYMDHGDIGEAYIRLNKKF